VIKWPNDLLINGKKVCGILIESQAPANGQPFSIIGIGVNVDFDTRRFPEIAEIATSISAHLEDKITVEEVALRVLNELEPLYYRIADSEGIRALWLDGMETIGRRVSVNTGKAIEHGIADTVDEAGNLVLRRDDNSLLTVIAGDVTLLKD
jgi:BirA family biotin operon repressor/biotin-[acetyl-CoA-carboxylase] ligase